MAQATLTKITVYTDGGADPNPGPGGWGAVLIDAASGFRRELSGSEAHSTNNRMELSAAIGALEALRRPCQVTLYTDSEYMRGGVRGWARKAALNGWQREGKPVPNADLWERLLQAAERHEVDWRWVQGHTGDEFNERAHQLATAAIRELHREQPTSSSATRPPAAEIYLLVSGRGAQAYWAALIRQGEEEDLLFRHEPGITSNALDIIAATRALAMLDQGLTVDVFTLSDYLRNGATQWLSGWKQRHWMKKDGSPVANREHWEGLDQQMALRRVRWPVVKSDDAPAGFEMLSMRAQEAFEEGQGRDPFDEGLSPLPPLDLEE